MKTVDPRLMPVDRARRIVAEAEAGPRAHPPVVVAWAKARLLGVGSGDA